VNSKRLSACLALDNLYYIQFTIFTSDATNLSSAIAFSSRPTVVSRHIGYRPTALLHGTSRRPTSQAYPDTRLRRLRPPKFQGVAIS